MLRIVIQGKIKEIVPDCDPSGVSDIKKHLKRKFMEKPSQDDNTPLDTELLELLLFVIANINIYQ